MHYDAKSFLRHRFALKSKGTVVRDDEPSVILIPAYLTSRPVQGGSHGR